ncbi:MAG: carboxy terminal-processing peptidase [Bacteroidales bacterium]|nr:carboxy terminal-processing peptidase [Bacteroidales bacterium]
MSRLAKLFTARILTVLLILVSLSLSLLAFRTENQEKEKSEVLIDLIYQGLNINHFSTINLNDDFSKMTYDLYLDRLDYGKRFLLQSDVAEWEKYTYKLDDEIRNKTTMFLEESIDTLNHRMAFVESVYEKLLNQPYDFKTPESLEVDAEKRTYPANLTELEDLWRKIFKYQVMTRIYEDLAGDSSETKEIASSSFTEAEQKAREKVLKSTKEWFKRSKEITYADYRSLYLNSILNVVDPHSAYFPPEDKENFDISMSGQFEGIGATLSVKDGVITVAAIVPGSASDRQGELEIEDKILKVAQGAEEPVDVVDMPLDQAVRLIRGKKGSEVRLTIRKADNTIKIIPIIRDVVILEETYAKSLILERDSKIGYIKLPKFYADFTKSGGKTSSMDMKTEIQKLQKEGIEGLIIDLRDNGGGSLQDAVEIAGYFIESGPVVQVKARGQQALVLDDKDASVLYDGPLTVLVNEYSASASEILAAALQDYNRAIILGSKSTFGKGTVQKMIELDRVLPYELRNLQPIGALKMTIQKFYRINGKTTQLYGVVPDIIFPEVNQYREIGEKELEHPLPFDEIATAKFNTWNTKKISDKIAKLEAESRKRIAQSEAFRLIQQNAEILKNRDDETLISLNYQAYENYRKQITQESSELKNKLKEDTGIKVVSIAEDLKSIESDSIKNELHTKWKNGLKKDVELYETVHVMDDLVKAW